MNIHTDILGTLRFFFPLFNYNFIETMIKNLYKLRDMREYGK